MADEHFPCVVCNQHIRPRQEALQCDGCNRWQHRVCGTAISRATYRQMVRGEMEIMDWRCRDCSLPNLSSIISPQAESTRTSFQRTTDDLMEAERRGSADNSSFELDSPPSFEIPDDTPEDTLADPIPAAEEEVSLQPEFEVVDETSQRGKSKLFDGLGFSYTKKRSRGQTTYWWCSVRNKCNRCPATVIQKTDDFSFGSHAHNHQPLPGQLTAAKVITKSKKEAKRDVFKSAAVITEDVITEEVDLDVPCPALPKPVNIARAANRARQRLRPTEPTDLEFLLEEDHIEPGFFRQDVKVNGFRHLLFATDRQLHLLGLAKTWYMDATFKVVKEPFHQLFSVHAFVKSGTDDVKQLPLVFCIMSRRRRKDYKKVFQAIQDLVPNPRVKTVVADFETAMWRGCQAVFPQIKVRGCGFHWNQAVFRRVQQLGLEPAFVRQTGTYRYIKKVMALPYLPAEHIPAAFEHLERHATTTELQDLMTYIRATWIESSVWPVRSWSVFGLSVRTNNHVEGWHRRLNQRANRGNVQLYLLIDLLSKEAGLINLQMRLVSEGKLCSVQRRSTRNRHAAIIGLWQEYKDGNKTASQLLRAVSLEL